MTALILARANVVSADRLITLIWGDQLPTKPSQTLRSYVSHLRRTLDPERQAGARSGLLVTKSPGYLLDTASANVDVFDFENRSTRADRYLAVGRFEATLAETTGAIDLWRSDDLVDSPLVHFSGERERLVELRLHTVGVGFDAMLGAGRHREAIPDLRRLVEREPLREHPRSQLMLALHRSGRSAEAVDVYHAGHRILIEETGFDPSTLLRELEARILANDPDLDWRGPEPLGDTNRDRSIASIETAPSAWSVGREKEVALIVDAISPPVGELVVMTGEPGIGKTRLAELAAGQAGERGMLSAWGHCYQGARSATLAPWRAALAMMTEHLDDHCLHDLGYLRAAQLGQLVPELAARVGVEPIETGDPQALQEAIVQFIRHVIKEQPLLLCFEDLHWADPASVWLLVHLLPLVRGLPFASVATWRDTDPTSDELQTALVELAKQGPDHRLRLTGFDVDAVADLWAGIRGQPGSPRAVAELQARTEGNPLFVTELLRPPIGAPPEMSPAPSAQLSAAVSTTTINDVIEARLAQLPEGCDELLTICALSPDSATPELLSQVLGQDGDHVIDQIDSLLAAGLIVDMSPPAPTLKVRHSVIADNLTGRLSEARKAQLHTQIAESLRQLKAPAGPLAHHFLSGLAQDPKVVAQAALDAAVDSSALHDHLGAIDLVERGLSALKRDDDDLLRARLMIVLAVEHKHQEHFNQAHSAALEGFALARRQGDLDLMVAATMVFCGFRAADVHYGVEWLGYWNPPGPALEILDVCLDELGPCHQRVFCLVARADQFIGDY
ncbi:MAG: AAA family ATPase, partial [Actinomycetia bacterium]|nr:AAA family ATPase [Actinomycetes bacterium]